MVKNNGNLDQKYQYIGFLPNSVRIKENGYWGMNDYNGNVILPSNYIEVFTLSSGYGLIAARDAGFWDIYDYNGNKLNAEKIDDIYPYYGLFGITKIKIGSNWGMINKFGKVIIPADYKKIDKFGRGIKLVTLNSEIEFIERNDLIRLTETQKIPVSKKVKKPIPKSIIGLSRYRPKTA